MIHEVYLVENFQPFHYLIRKLLVAGEGTDYTNMPIESAPPLEILQAEKEAALQNTDEIEGNGDGGEPKTTF